MALLSERRKSDRAKMATELASLIRGYGYEPEIEKEGESEAYPRAWIVALTTARGLCCRFEFDGESCQHDVYVNAWHMSLNTDACLSDRFPGSVNQAHFHKSTTVAEGFESLKGHVIAVLEGDRDGRIYDADREAAQIAKSGTWQEKAARFEQWRNELAAERAATAAA